MNTDFWVGFVTGMVALSILLCFIFAFAPKKPKGKKEIDYKVTKPPVINAEYLQSVLLTVTADVPYEEIRHINDEWHKGNIMSKLKLKMIEKVWEFVNVEMTDDPRFFEKRYTAKLRVLTSDRKAFLHEVAKKEL